MKSILLRLILVSAVFLTTSRESFSQTDEVLVDLADEMFSFGDPAGALGLYLQAIEENPNNVRAQYMAGRSYLLSVDSKEEAVKYLKKATELDPEVSDKLYYYLGEAYRHAYQFEEAIESYEVYKADLAKGIRDPKTQLRIDRANVRIMHCRNALEITKTKVNVNITNLGKEINTLDNEYAPVLSANEKVLIFTSRRLGSTGKLKDRDNLPFEDVYISRRDGDHWGEAQNIGETINTDKHDATIGLSADGNALYIYKGTGNGDIYESKFKGGEWSKPVAIKEVNGKKTKETSINVTHPGYRYFSSNKEGGEGKMDLYVIKQDEKGKWGKPENLGNVINTEFDEESPYYDPNNKILYFSSKGHKSMGGYDIFQSKFNEETGEWGTPKNIGHPINSPDDDIYFTLSGDSKRGYYSSFKEGGFGGNDIYVITFDPEDPEPPVVEEPIVETKDTTQKEPEYKKVELNVNVIAYGSEEPLDATIEIVDKATGEKVINTIAHGGEFSIEFSDEQSKDYEVYCSYEGYVYKNISITIPSMTEEEQKIYKMVAMKKPAPKQINALRNIYFDFDLHTLKKESYAELDNLLAFLNQNPSVKIEIAGHTDFVGPDGYNDVLSKQRAQAVVRYLLQKGIDSSRIVARGYGENKPLASNDDFPELNRRTEFIILE